MTDPRHNFTDSPVLPDLLQHAAAACSALDALSDGARAALRAGGRDVLAAEDQRAAHGLAWLATYAESLRQLLDWARRLENQGAFGPVEALITQIGFGEYLAQIDGGIPMSQTEILRPADLGLSPAYRARFRDDAAVTALIAAAGRPARAALAARLAAADGAPDIAASGLDEDMEMVRDQFRRFAAQRVAPHAHGWHLRDDLIPADLIAELADLGVFGLTIPEAFGGAGLGKTAMCVVSEELSRGYIGVGSLGTRSEIAAELILTGGTDAQRAAHLPGLADGSILPTAVFTEPDVGSDLGALKTRAVRDGDDWVLTGAKTWITHGARSDLMTVLARTDPDSRDHRGLSMFLAPKTRGSEAAPFPDATISGGEIEVLGYRGMKEYTLTLDGHRVPGAALLGGQTGQGFKQLMQTFESARIQTAARAVGVAQSALDLAAAYARDRRAFGQTIDGFARVGDKLAMMAVEITIARQLTYFAAREKDARRRCDLEAGMAKLLAARVAWAAADNGVQVHGGNGFALEYPISRVLCDARILNIFEGAAEIQAQVIAGRLLQD
ncbi:MAG: acyl-CoA dehydrogenase family protein [Pseudomonadota bacterium]